MLVAVTEPHGAGTDSFRAQSDSTFTRYERVQDGDVASFGFYWRAYATDGKTYFFGDRDHVNDCTIVSDEYAPLTREVDEFGNRVDYYYNAGVPGECVISEIQWGRNDAAGIGIFAQAAFVYATTPLPACSGVPVGSQTSLRTGTQIVTGASELDSINITALPPGSNNPDHTRVITLSYLPNTGSQSADCTSSHGPYRSLYSIQESAWGTDSPRVDLPAVKFEYGDASMPLATWFTESAEAVRWGDPYPYNLGWGFRFTDGEWPTVEAMMVDIDGDGLLDRVYNASSTDPATGRFICRAGWEKNMGWGHPFVDKGSIGLPTLKWAGPPATSCSTADQGGNSPGAYAPSSDDERCALNYQRTSYDNGGSQGATYYCANGAACLTGTCPDGTDCGRSQTPKPTYLAYRWMDVDGDSLVDLVASPAEDTEYNLQWGTLVPGQPNACIGNIPGPEPAYFGTFPACPSTPVTVADGSTYTMCEGMHPWFIYKNHGNGVFGRASTFEFPLPDKVIYQPISLETSSGDSSITTAPVGPSQGVLDVDGDGYPDGVWLDGVNPWQVYRNDGTGQFVAASGATPFTFSGATERLSSTSIIGIPPNSDPWQDSGLTDYNGDGLTDHWAATSDGTQSTPKLNTGTGMNSPSPLAQSNPGTDGKTVLVCSVGHTCSGGAQALYGYRRDLRRGVDVDLDGRLDVLLNDQGSWNFSQVCFNVGGDFQTQASTCAAPLATDDVPALRRKIVAIDGLADNRYLATQYGWELRSDLIDIDGDGIPEGMDFQAGADGVQNAQQLYVAKVPTPTAAPRLLVSIDNQRGAVTSVSYAPTSGSSAVVQDTVNGKIMPHVQWVVQSLTTVDNLPTTNATTSTTSYKYINPRFSADDQGKYAFRGFEEVDATLPSGATRVDRYDYAADWSGRLYQTVMRPSLIESTIANEARTIDTTTWQRRGLFGDSCVPLSGDNCSIVTYHPVVSEHLTCKNGQSDDPGSLQPCDSTRAAGYTKTTTLWTSYQSTTVQDSTQLLWGVFSTTLQSGTVDADGDRQTLQTYDVDSDGSTYRVRAKMATKQVRTGGSWSTYAQSRTRWTNNYSTPEFEDVWFDPGQPPDSLSDCVASAQNCGTTHLIYDLNTGNVLARYKPMQYSGDLAHVSYTYDTRQLFVAQETDEPAGSHNDSMVLSYIWEYGTGTKLETDGPNIPGCATTTPNTCGGTPLTEVHRIRIDGLGRTIERYGSAGDLTNTYPQYKLEYFVYSDAAYPTPTSVHHYNGYGLSGSTVLYADDLTELDGHGRPMRKTSFVHGTAPVDAVTTFQYANDGTLASVTMPDPTANDATTVSYTYTFDSLGRPTSIRRPDGASTADRSGVDILYDGLTTTSSEFVGAAGGLASVTTTIKDAFGRLAEVDEQTVAGTSPSWATTTYTYDPADNVQTIVDPEAVTTTLQHDLAGRRVAITRDGRSWTYGYDKNGNMISEVVPFDSGVDDILNYTTTIAYDDLDREVSRVIGHRNLTAADVSLFGADREVQTWDNATNRRGHLTTWAAYGTGAVYPNSAAFNQFYWDAGGVIYNTQEVFTANGYSNVTRNMTLAHTVNGVPYLATYGDPVGGNNYTASTIHLDARGLPSFISLTSTDGLNASIATQTRNVAGLVTKQHTSVSNSPITAIDSNWTYDKLGRVASQVVQESPNTVKVAEQDLTYFGNDDPASLDQWLGASNHKHFNYQFDLRHQITSATETTTTGYFTGSYHYGNAGRFDSVTVQSGVLPLNNEINPRDVVYQYPSNPPAAGYDREEVMALTSGAGNAANYDYDYVGNQTVRCYGTWDYVNKTCTGSGGVGLGSGEYWTFVYDGKDQLRRASHFSSANVLQGKEEYWYGANGNRTQTIKYDGSGNKTELVFWNGDTEAHYDGTGVLQHVYSYVTMGTAVARVDRTGNTTPTYEFLFHGLGGGTLAAVDKATGNVTASFSYAPFGEIIEAVDGGGFSTHRRRFNDKYEDEVDNLAYYGARYYDHLTMTWTQADPMYLHVPEQRGVRPRHGNLYTFSLNNPLRYIDPNGLESVWNPTGNDPNCNGLTSLCEDPSQQADSTDDHDISVLDTFSPLNWIEKETTNEAVDLGIWGADSVRNFADASRKAVDAVYWSGQAGNSFGSTIDNAQKGKGGAAINSANLFMWQAGIAIALTIAGIIEGGGKPRLPGIGGSGWRGDAQWRAAVKQVASGGTIRAFNGKTATLEEALDLIHEAGGRNARPDMPHEPPNPHDFHHVNYTTPSGDRGTIEVSPFGEYPP